MKRLILGNPIPNEKAESHKLGKFKALPIFSSDALSSVAYATGEIFTVLMVTGAAMFTLSLYIAVAVCILVLIVGISYRQVISAYPEGGGSYVVARENLGVMSSLVAAASLLIDYVLTVAVSTSAGILAITSAFPELESYAVIMAIIAVILLMWMNLRGIQESATVFMWPTYLFVLMILVMIGIGIYRYSIGDLSPADAESHIKNLSNTAGILSITIILRAFSSGCSAMTGIEAVSNGVQAFEQPREKNARTTLLVLMILLIMMFGGITFLAVQLQLDPTSNESLLSQLSHSIYGSGALYYTLQGITCLILILAANTSFAGFPMLASVVSKDGFLPKQLENVGDRLAFSNGIIALAIIAIALIVIFDANTSMLIPLYSLGVFTAFTLCQLGMVIFWYRRREETKGWWSKAFINGLGCVATAITVIMVIESKFFEGAWIVAFAIPLVVWVSLIIKSHYETIDDELELKPEECIIPDIGPSLKKKQVVVFLSSLHIGSLQAIKFAKRMSNNVVVVTVVNNSEKKEKIIKQWEQLNMQGELKVIETKFRSIVRPLLKFVDRCDAEHTGNELTTIVIPNAVTKRGWHRLLHNQKAHWIMSAIKTMSKEKHPGCYRVIIEVPYLLKEKQKILKTVSLVKPKY